MERSKIDMLKGIPPGKIIGRELKRRDISQRAFASAIQEHSQTLNAIITGRRRMTTEMALKIESALDFDEGFLLTLQVYHDIAEYKNLYNSNSVSGIPNVRRCLFWDTDFDNIDWGKYKAFIINRVLERGNDEEIAEIARFYDMEIAMLESYRRSKTYSVNQTHNKHGRTHQEITL